VPTSGSSGNRRAIREFDDYQLFYSFEDTKFDSLDFQTMARSLFGPQDTLMNLTQLCNRAQTDGRAIYVLASAGLSAFEILRYLQREGFMLYQVVAKLKEPVRKLVPSSGSAMFYTYANSLASDLRWVSLKDPQLETVIRMVKSPRYLDGSPCIHDPGTGTKPVAVRFVALYFFDEPDRDEGLIAREMETAMDRLKMGIRAQPPRFSKACN